VLRVADDGAERMKEVMEFSGLTPDLLGGL